MFSMHYGISRATRYCAFVLLLIVDAFSLSNFTNYQSVISVNDIIVLGKKAWAATSGGLLFIDPENHTQTLFSDIYSFPDLDLTSLSLDSKGNLWIGSSRGYLYKRSPDGRSTMFGSYFGAQWGIRDIVAYRDYVIVGSSKGCAIFDPIKGVSVRNTTAMDTAGDPSVNAIAVHNDSLYLGCNNGYDAFNVSGDNLQNGTYLDPSQWTATYTGSAIVSFADSSGTLLPQKNPSLFIGQSLYYSQNTADSFSFKSADSMEVKIPGTSYLYAGKDLIFKVPGSVTRLASDENNNLWVGTDQNYLYYRNGAQVTQYKVQGLTFDYCNRLYASSTGAVWVLPQVSENPPWWQGIASYDGRQWTLFNRFSTPGIGAFAGGGPDFHGICEDRDGNMWFGTSGANVRYYDVRKNLWTILYFAGDTTGNNYGNDSIRQLSVSENIWGKHDAIAQDSSGYMWVANYSNTTRLKSGCLVCYDPTHANIPNYRRFFPISDNDHHIPHISAMSVDARGTLLVGGDNGRLLALSHNGHPLQNGVQVVLYRSDLTGVTAMSATSSGATYISAGKVLYKYTTTGNALAAIATIQNSITGVAAETDSLIWLGTSDGLVRYDAGKDSMKTIDMTNGLISNAVKDISIDKKNGFLWVATDEGLSRYALGHSSVPIAGNASIIAYPNPFSLSNPSHREIVFKHCAAGARVFIYAMNGSLIKQLSRENDDAYQIDDNPYETTLHWIPSKKLAPGTYYFIGQSQKPVKTKKLLIIP